MVRILTSLPSRRTLGEHDRHRRTAETDIDRAVVFGRRPHAGLSFNIVSGAHDDHAGDPAHQLDILQTLMGRAVLAHAYPGMGGTDLDVQLGIPDGITDLLISAAYREHGK